MGKINKFFTRNLFQIIILSLIVLIGIYFRILYLNKPEGLWFDEVYSHYIAKESFPFGILNKLYHEDVHAPLYYFILHFWMKLFGDNDITLRLLSVLIGTLIIPIAYITGKELHTKSTGLLFAGLVSINSLLIYYSQEVRFYILIVLFAVLSILFLIRISKNPNKWNFIGLILSDLGIIYSFTIGFVFVLIEIGVFSLYFYLKNKKYLKPYLIAQSITLIFFLPYIPTLMHYLTPGESFFPSSPTFNPLHAASVIVNIFSPVLVSLYSTNGSEILKSMFSNSVSSMFYGSLIIPSLLIYLIGIKKAIQEKNFSLLFLINAILLFIFIIIMEMLDKFQVITRYFIMIIPAILLSASFGLLNIRRKALMGGLICFLILFNMLFLILSLNSAPKKNRLEGFKPLGEMLNKTPFDKRDTVIMPYGYMLLYKYYPGANKPKTSDFNIYQVRNIRNQMFYEKDFYKSVTPANSYKALRAYLSLNEPSSPLKKFMIQDIIGKTEKGRYVIIILFTDLKQRYKPEDLKKVVSDDNMYYKESLYMMLKSKMLNDLFSICIENMEPIGTMEKGSWTVVAFRKK